MGNIFGDDDEKEIQRLREQHKREEAARQEKLRKQNEEAMRAYERGLEEERRRRENIYSVGGGKKSNICGAMFKKNGKKMRCTKKKGHWFGHG